MRFIPKIGTVLIALALICAVLPLVGAHALRILECELVRRTEAELIAQGAVLAAAYKTGALEALNMTAAREAEESAGTDYGAKIHGRPGRLKEHPDSGITPIFPLIDIYHDPLLPPPPDGLPTDIQPDQVAIMGAKVVDPLLESARKVTLAGVRILDHRGMVVASTGAEMGLDISNRPEIKRALAGRYSAVLRVRGYGYPKPSMESISRRSGYRVYSALPIINRDRVIGVVALVRTPIDTLKALYSRRTDLLVMGAFVFAAIISICLLTSIFISRPIKHIGLNAKRIAEGAYNAPQDLRWPLTQETKNLAHTFNLMVDSLEKRANYFRSFAYNVSHELKTPLTSMTGSVELLQDHLDSMDDGEKRRFLGIIKGDLGRLERLMTKLLELARADTVRPEASQIDVVPVVSDIVERFRKRGLKVEHTSVEGAILAPISEEALDSIVSNLLENSMRHGGPDVTASVSLRRIKRGEDYFLGIETRDNGLGIPDFDREKIFDRFYTTSKEAGGTGLGLSIVKTIVEAHEGTIELPPVSKGSLFTITLPAKPRK